MLRGVARAAGGFIAGQANPGGATIEQQLAKALYGSSGSIATLRQIGLGIKLGMDYSRRRILGMYLNVNYYGHGFWGVNEAAEGYFGVRPAHLNWAEASMLAGLLQAPSAYDPLRHYRAARARSDTSWRGWSPTARSRPPEPARPSGDRCPSAPCVSRRWGRPGDAGRRGPRVRSHRHSGE